MQYKVHNMFMQMFSMYASGCVCVHVCVCVCVCENVVVWCANVCAVCVQECF